jgi:hypothetical protein
LVNNRAGLQQQLNAFYAVARNDERVRETLLSRGASALIQWRNVMNGNDKDDNVDLFLFDYCLELGFTKTWKPEIKLDSRADPITFPRDGSASPSAEELSVQKPSSSTTHLRHVSTAFHSLSSHFTN